MRLGEEGYFWEPTMETFLRGGGTPALQSLCTKGRGRPGLGQSLPCLSHQASPQRPGDGD